jgi:putative NADH-flavin reductase
MAKLTIFGATGGTGRQLVRQALDAGHHVTAVVRDPARLPVRHAELEVMTADVTDPAALRPALSGRDAAVSALAASRRQGDLATAAARATLAALDACGVRRLVVVSAVPVGPPPDGEPLWSRTLVLPLLRLAFRDTYADLAVMEEELRRSRAEWTVVRPPRLVDRPLTGAYQRVVGGNVPGGTTIARADLAHAILRLLEDPATVRQVVGVAY